MNKNSLDGRAGSKTTSAPMSLSLSCTQRTLACGVTAKHQPHTFSGESPRRRFRSFDRLHVWTGL